MSDCMQVRAVGIDLSDEEINTAGELLYRELRAEVAAALQLCVGVNA